MTQPADMAQVCHTQAGDQGPWLQCSAEHQHCAFHRGAAPVIGKCHVTHYCRVGRRVLSEDLA